MVARTEHNDHLSLAQALLNSISDDFSFASKAKDLCPRLDGLCMNKKPTLEKLRALCELYDISFKKKDSSKKLIRLLTPDKYDRTLSADMLRIELGIWNRCDYFLHSTTLTYEEAKQRCDRVGRDLDKKMSMAPFHIPPTKQERNKMTHLHLNGKLSDGDTLRDFLIFIASGALPKLEKLFLDENEIGDAGLIAFAEALKSPRGALGSLVTLWLEQNRIGKKGMQAFSSAIATGALPLLEKLILSGNAIGDAGLFALVDAVKPSSANPRGALPRLEQLLLDSNAIGDAGLISLADAVKPTPESPMGALGSLVQLKLWDNHIGDKGMKAFASAIASGALPSLETLVVNDGPLGTEHPQLKAACEARGILLSSAAVC